MLNNLSNTTILQIDLKSKVEGDLIKNQMNDLEAHDHRYSIPIRKQSESPPANRTPIKRKVLISKNK